MSIFDESEVEAGHKRLASSVSTHIEVLIAATDLTRKVLLSKGLVRDNPADHANYLATSMLGFRFVNGIGAVTKLLDCGYFIQAAAIGRDIAEVGMLALYFSENPRKLPEWRQIPREDRYKMFGRPQLSKSIRDRPRYDFLNVYFEQFSEFGAHPSSVSILPHHDGHDFQIGPHINQQLYINLHSDIAYLSWHVVDVFGDAYRVMYRSDASEVFPVETTRFRDAYEGIRRSNPRT